MTEQCFAFLSMITMLFQGHLILQLDRYCVGSVWMILPSWICWLLTSFSQWDLRTGKSLHTFVGHQYGVFGVQFDNNKLVHASTHHMVLSPWLIHPSPLASPTTRCPVPEITQSRFGTCTQGSVCQLLRGTGTLFVPSNLTKQELYDDILFSETICSSSEFVCLVWLSLSLSLLLRCPDQAHKIGPSGYGDFFDTSSRSEQCNSLTCSKKARNLSLLHV